MKASNATTALLRTALRILPEGTAWNEASNKVVTSSGSSEIGIGLTNVVDFTINGTRRNSINFLVDGVSNTDVGSNVTLLSVPTVDSIQEFRVITSVPTAEFGRSGCGVVNLITRGGGRDFHGTAYEFVRNDRLNANSFFNNANGTFGPNDATVRAV